MRTTIAAALFCAPLVAAAVPVTAQAQDRPQIFPTRDVAVTYRVAGQGQQAEMSIAWSAALRLMRVNMPGGLGFMVADHQNQRSFMVMEAMRSIMEVPIEQTAGFQRDFENSRFTRGGTAKIAGTDCTIWRFQGQSTSGEACITADGVTLRTQGTAHGQQGGVEATRIVYAPQDAAQFRRPQGYQTMQLPQGMPGQRPGTPR